MPIVRRQNGTLRITQLPVHSKANESKEVGGRQTGEISPMVKSWTTPSQERFAVRVRKPRLLIFSARIFDSSVERGIPSRAAAPEGPKTRPPQARKASLMIVFS
jgi:hypothetical protein